MIIAHVLEALFWISAGLLVYTHAAYPLVLALLTQLSRSAQSTSAGLRQQATASLVIAAYNEGAVIARKI